MEKNSEGQVALLIDFEKLAKAEDIDCEVLISFAEEYGRVLIAKAYADWNGLSYQNYLSTLSRFGIDPVKAMEGTIQKNLVEMKLVVDAIDLIRTMPHINIFVIVSGDRDFIHLYKALRSHGKKIIGISPQVYYSPNLERYCDRFVQYEYIAGAKSLDLTPASQTLEGQVALLVDFEKLASADDVDCEVLITFAEEHGRVLIANAYADWRDFSYQAYQGYLHRFGIDLVQVMEDSLDKNSVEMKLVVDAIDLIRTMPHINIFVIVSGDRDFIYLYKVLRSHGKTIINISPQMYCQPNLVRCCDRFVQYEYIAGAQSLDLAPVSQTLQTVMSAYPDGLPVHQVKKLLRQELSSIFDERSYGFEKFQQLLYELEDVVVLKEDPCIGEILVYPTNLIAKTIKWLKEFFRSAGTRRNRLKVIKEISRSKNYTPADQLLSKINKRLGYFFQNTYKRRKVLKAIFVAINSTINSNKLFNFESIYAHVAKSIPNQAVVHSHLMGAYHGNCFEKPASANDLPPEKQQLCLLKRANTERTFIYTYEIYVASTLRKLIDNEQEFSESLLAEILGLPEDEDSSISRYCKDLFRQAIEEDDDLVEDDDSADALLRKLDRRLDSFCQDVDERRNTLKIIFAAIIQQFPFYFDEIYDRIEKMDIENKPLPQVVQGYLNSVLDERHFRWAASQEELPAKERQYFLKEQINTEEAFIRAYEQQIAFVLRKLMRDEQELSASLLVELLGLSKDEGELAYCQSLFDALDQEKLLAALLRELEGFCQDADKRRNTLKIIFAVITQQHLFYFDEIYDCIENMDIENKPLPQVVQGYLNSVLDGGHFIWAVSQEELPAKRRQYSLKEQINTEDAFIRAYEQQIALTLHKLIINEQKLSPSLLAELLGLSKDEGELAYCQSLFDALDQEEDDDSVAALLRKLDKRLDGFCQDVDERRNTLKIIFAAITQQHFFRFDEIYAHIEKMDIENKPLYNVVQSSLKNVYDRCFRPASQEELPTGKRQWSLKGQINTEDAFIFSYEQEIALTLRELMRDEQELSSSLLVEILGLPKDEEELAYCQSLFDALAQEKLATAAARKFRKKSDILLQDADERRNTLKIIFVAISQQRFFRFDEIYAHIEKMDIEKKPHHYVVQSYLESACEGRCFRWIPSQEELPAEERQWSLKGQINTEADFIRAYEKQIAFTLHKLISNEQELSASLLADILDLPKDEEELAYCQSLFDALAQEKLATAAAQKFKKKSDILLQDADERRNTLKIIFVAISQQRSFRFNEIYARIEKISVEEKPHHHVVQSYLKSAYEGRCFSWTPSQEELPAEERQWSLKGQINTEADFIRAYEKQIAFTLHKLISNEQELSASLLADILDLPKDKEELAYCQSLFDALAQEEYDNTVAALLRKLDDFCQDADERRNTLKIIFSAITQQRSFHFDEICACIEKMNIENKPLYNVVQSYLMSAFYGKLFKNAASENELPVANEKLSLIKQINTEEAFIHAYERNVVSALRKLVDNEQDLSTSLLAGVLGLSKDEKDLAYCQSLLDALG